MTTRPAAKAMSSACRSGSRAAVRSPRRRSAAPSSSSERASSAARRRTLEVSDRVAKLREALVAAEDQAGDGQRLPDVARRVPDARPGERRLGLPCGGRLVAGRVVQPSDPEPAVEDRIDRALALEPAVRELVGQRALCVASRSPQGRARGQQPIRAGVGRDRIRAARRLEHRLRLVELAALDEHLDQARRAHEVLPHAGRERLVRRPGVGLGLGGRPLSARSRPATWMPPRTRVPSRGAAPRRLRSPPCDGQHRACRS